MTSDQLREAAAARIFARRDEILHEQERIREEQERLARRDRELARELVECRAAARFFGLDIDPPTDDPQVATLRQRVSRLRLQAEAARANDDQEAADRLLAVASHHEMQARQLSLARAREVAQRANAAASLITATASAVTLAASARSAAASVVKALENPPSPPPAPSAASVSPPPAAQKKIPRIRDIVLDQLRAAGASGQKATPMRRYIESTYSTEIHDKTVGMTLYRLAQEHLVHRKGQIWFFGPSPDASAGARPENPGAATPGLTQAVN